MVASRECARAADDLLDSDSQCLSANSKDARVVTGQVRNSGLSRYRERFGEGVASVSRRLRRIALDEHFIEALLWQNPEALHTGMGSLVRRHEQTASHNSRNRRAEELVASYWQRYCLKNDTIGFFGPTGWARWSIEVSGLKVTVGPRLIQSHRVYFEAWAIDAVAKALTSSPQWLLWATPRLLPFIRLQDNQVFIPGQAPAKLPSGLLAALYACDGVSTAKEIVDRLVQEDTGLVETEKDALKLLAELRDRSLISWALDIPLQTFPEDYLRAVLGSAEPGPVRDQAIRSLDSLEVQRDAVSAAAGNVDLLRASLSNLNRVFTEVTGVPATRSPGSVMSGRTLVYEDCVRDIDVQLGQDVLEALGPPITLLLVSARWFTSALAERYRAVFKEVFESLRKKSSCNEVDFPTFWLAALPIVRNPSIVSIVQTEFQQRWSSILGIPSSPRFVEYSYSTASIGDEVRRVFAASHPGWLGARYHSPDILIEAPNVEAIQGGDYRLVMGELHIGINALRHASFLAQHPRPSDLLAAIDSDIPESRVIPVPPKQGAWGTSRGYQALVSKKDFRISFLHDLGGVPPAKSLPMGTLSVRYSGNELEVLHRDTNRSFDIIEIYADALTDLVFSRFKMIDASPFAPAVIFDRLVVSRPTWRIPAADLGFSRDYDEATRFLNSRQWWRSKGLPRFVFIKTPLEQKPFYVDFDSPTYVSILAKGVRRMLERGMGTTPIELSGMLPSFSSTWLLDAAGNHYTSEFRMVAVDRGTLSSSTL